MSSPTNSPIKLPQLILIVLLAARSSGFAQGSLTPPGTPAPTMKSLAQIEPRTPISSIPITISNAGSYYLTTNLTGAASSSGITVSADNVTLDLNGFALVGVGGSLNGITAPTPISSFTVRNGTIRNWIGSGISVSASDSTFERLSLLSNSSTGLSGGTHALVRDCAVASNGSGIVVGQGSDVRNCIVRSNSLAGISTGEACSIVDCTVFRNGTQGILLANASSVERCVVKTNLQNGILGLANNSITRCIVSQNNSNGISLSFGCRVTDCVVTSNKVDGIRIEARCTVTGNTCDYNGTTGTHAGIRAVDTDNRIDGNDLSKNFYGIFSEAGFNLIVRNKATLNTTAYSFTTDDKAGPTSTNAATAGPWANFAY